MVLAFDLSIASRPKRCVPDVAYTLLCQEVRESRGVERRTVVRPNRMRYPVPAEVSIHTLNNGIGNSRLDDVDFVKTVVEVNQHSTYSPPDSGPSKFAASCSHGPFGSGVVLTSCSGAGGPTTWHA